MVIRARGPARSVASHVERDPAVVAGYLEDASGAAPGTAAGLARVADEGEAAGLFAATLPSRQSILCQAARTSLTGGAVPRGELIVSVERMASLGRIERHAGGGRVRAQPGIRLDELQRRLAGEGLYYPPVPTYAQAMLGGTVATNAGGAATFKYGVTRQWIHALRVVLFNGDVIELERGQVRARPGESFEIRLADGRRLAVPVPDHRLPPLKKISAGYHAADPLDLVDLFVGSEGTLGLITEVTLELVPLPAAVVTGLVFPPTLAQALSLAGELRVAALAARERDDPRAPDVRAIEVIDAAGLRLLRRHGDDRRLRVALPDDAGAALLFELELPEPATDETVQQTVFGFLEGQPVADGPVVRLCDILRRHAALEHLELAFPEDESRQHALRQLREAVPLRVNELLAERKRERPELRKVGGDLIVPFERLAEMLRFYERGFRRRGLEYAVWGHLSDGNLHPNALPRDAHELDAAIEALLEFADEAVRLGGCPLSEHGVGRDPLKQELLRRFVGDAALRTMQRVKAALDPPRRLAPGVLFPASFAEQA